MLAEQKGTTLLTSLRRGLTAAAATAVAVGGLALSAQAATPQCTAVALAGCGSWNAEVPNLPDLDVYGGGATSGNALIMFTRSNHDKAEDFAIINVTSTAVNKYPGTGPAAPPAHSVAIEYAPFGVASGLCVSTVNPNGFTAVQLRTCSNNLTQFNPFQTFVSQAAVGDGTFVSFLEVIHGLALTDPRNSGSIGVVGHRVHVITRTYTGTSGQLWGQNGA